MISLFAGYDFIVRATENTHVNASDFEMLFAMSKYHLQVNLFTQELLSSFILMMQYWQVPILTIWCLQDGWYGRR